MQCCKCWCIKCCLWYGLVRYPCQGEVYVARMGSIVRMFESIHIIEECPASDRVSKTQESTVCVLVVYLVHIMWHRYVY